MDELHPLELAIGKVGLAKLARELRVTAPAIRKWQRAGRLPRTEWTGETDYAKRIERLCGGSPSAEQLLKPWPKWPAETPMPGAEALQPHAAAQELELVERRVKDQPIDFEDRRAKPAGEDHASAACTGSAAVHSARALKPRDRRQLRLPFNSTRARREGED